jgi:hypothetical protein
MRGRNAERIERAIDHLAAFVLAGAGAFAFTGFLSGQLGDFQLRLVAAAAAPTLYLITVRALRRISPKRPSFDVRAFAIEDLDFSEPDELLLTEQVELLLTEQVALLLTEQAELVLTDADRLDPSEDELILDDIVAELSPDSRVVRLFDPATLPTAGQLNSRIEQHLREGTARDAAAPAGTSDAAQALHQALAELRRSLR